VKNLFQSLIILFISTSSLAQLEWESRKSIPRYGRHAGVSFEIAGKIYVGLGRIADGSYSNELWEYDPDSDNWTQKADYPGGARFIPTAFAINGKGYVCLGQTSSFSPTNTTYEYNPSNDTWTQKANFIGTSRYGAVAFVIGDTAYVGTGSNGSGSYLNDFYMYVPASNSWTARANYFGGSAANLATFTIGNFGYVGNKTASGSAAPDNSFYKFSPSTNSWSSIASMPGSSRRISAAFVLNNEAYVGCGTNSNSPISTFLNDFYTYTPTTNSWSYHTSNAGFTPKIDPEFITIGDSAVYSITGYSSDQSLSEIWQLKLGFDTCDYFDTTFVQDTTLLNYTIYDTITEVTFDTVLVYTIDTLYQTIYDTAFITTYDTVTRIVYDTTIITSYDTIYTTYNIAVEDTLIVNLYADNCGNVLHKIYPNPTKDYLYLSSNGPDCFEGYKVQFIDALGKILETKPYGNVVTFDIRGYARSLYFLRLIGPAGDAIFSEKIILD
jgi:N-acetylneuraminic acid mutarotase